jgi:malonyl-CoA decarboxylase
MRRVGKLVSGASFFSDLLQTITDRGRLFLAAGREGAGGSDDLPELCDALLAGRGEASGIALAAAILEVWRGLDADGRLNFLSLLASRYGPDRDRLAEAIRAYQAASSACAAGALHEAAEPRRQELIRRLNLAAGAIPTLIAMREALLDLLPANPELAEVDADFVHLLSSWFNRGFLVLRRIDWSTPANILEKIIRYEAVHQIHDWNDLRRRLAPDDRRCFGFFHPQLVDEPLIFVEVALMREMPAAIAEVLSDPRTPLAANDATMAVFYSISNCQRGLGGISFGSFLIKQVIEELRAELPLLRDFVTLSPVPRFAEWLSCQRRTDLAQLAGHHAGALAALDRDDWHRDPETVAALRDAILPVAAHFLVNARSANGVPRDPVARFHLGNGARIERLNFPGDLSDKARGEAHGLMANYSYKLDDIERNHELFFGESRIAASPAVHRLARDFTRRSEAPRRKRRNGPLASRDRVVEETSR